MAGVTRVIIDWSGGLRAALVGMLFLVGRFTGTLRSRSGRLVRQRAANEHMSAEAEDTRGRERQHRLDQPHPSPVNRFTRRSTI
jgi:hypothetical protein